MNLDKLSELNINLSNQLTGQINKYVELFLEYNAHTNLISKNDEKVLFEKHIYDSLSVGLIPEITKVKSLIDIGTGGGFPAVPIALCFPNINVLGVDSIEKKIKFIKSLTAELQIKNLNSLTSRTEDLPKNYIESFDIATSRAVAPLNTILEYAVPYLKIGGLFVAYKSKITNKEIEEAQNALKTLSCKVKNIISYNLPLEENYQRNLVIIQKLKATPQKFPRRVGLAKTNPL